MDYNWARAGSLPAFGGKPGVNREVFPVGARGETGRFSVEGEVGAQVVWAVWSPTRHGTPSKKTPWVLI